MSTRKRTRLIEDRRAIVKAMDGAGSRVDLEDMVLHLAEAELRRDDERWIGFLQWAKSRGEGDLAEDLEALGRVVRSNEAWAPAAARVAFARDLIEDMTPEPETWLDPAAAHHDLACEWMDLLIESRRTDAIDLVTEAVEEGLPLADVYLNVFQPTLREVGRLWQINEIEVATEHYCTASTQLAMGRLHPLVFDGGEHPGRTFVSACVGREIHELGARMVADFFEMSGWKTVFLGSDVTEDGIVDTLVREHAFAVGLSVTSWNHVADASRFITRLRGEEACAGVRVLAGGRGLGLSGRLATSIGADAWAPDAAQAVRVCEALRAEGGP